MTDQQIPSRFLGVPGLTVLARQDGPLGVATRRVGDNQWLLAVGDIDLDTPELSDTEPGAVACGRQLGDGPGLVCRIELDACGAWATIASTGDVRTFVVRRAGWVDERGDAVVDRRLPWPEDRVGLGPGDALVIVHETGPDAAVPLAEQAANPRALRLLAADVQAGRLLTAVDAAVVVEVPAEIAGAGPGWVAEATGVPEAELDLPGYPLGDAVDPSRWQRPPAAPRRAAFLLHRDLTRLSGLRSVLSRLMRSWRLGDRVDEDLLVLLTSEVAANALVHTSTDATAIVSYLGSTVRVTVVDGSSDQLLLRVAEEADLGGRGLAMLEASAVRWGTGVLPTGKQVWFELAVTDG